MDHKFIGEVAGVIAGIAYVLYIIAILTGPTKPSRVSWLVWASVNAVMALSYDAGGATDTRWVAVVHALGCIFIFLLSLHKGEGDLKKLFLYFFSKKQQRDWQMALNAFCLLGAGIGMILWWLFSSPGMALVMGIVADLFGLIPTLEKAWKKPKEEDFFAWTCSAAGSIVNLFAVNDWNALFIVSYPIYAVTGITAVWLILVIRRLQKISATPTPK